VVKIIQHKAASLPHEDGSVVFARWRQCAPYNTCFLWPTQVHNHGILIGSAIFGQPLQVMVRPMLRDHCLSCLAVCNVVRVVICALFLENHKWSSACGIFQCYISHRPAAAVLLASARSSIALWFIGHVFCSLSTCPRNWLPG